MAGAPRTAAREGAKPSRIWDQLRSDFDAFAESRGWGVGPLAGTREAAPALCWGGGANVWQRGPGSGRPDSRRSAATGPGQPEVYGPAASAVGAGAAGAGSSVSASGAFPTDFFPPAPPLPRRPTAAPLTAPLPAPPPAAFPPAALRNGGPQEAAHWAAASRAAPRAAPGAAPRATTRAAPQAAAPSAAAEDDGRPGLDGSVRQRSAELRRQLQQQAARAEALSLEVERKDKQVRDLERELAVLQSGSWGGEPAAVAELQKRNAELTARLELQEEVVKDLRAQLECFIGQTLSRLRAAPAGAEEGGRNGYWEKKTEASAGPPPEKGDGRKEPGAGGGERGRRGSLIAAATTAGSADSCGAGGDSCGAGGDSSQEEEEETTPGRPSAEGPSTHLSRVKFNPPAPASGRRLLPPTAAKGFGGTEEPPQAARPSWRPRPMHAGPPPPPPPAALPAPTPTAKPAPPQAVPAAPAPATLQRRVFPLPTPRSPPSEVKFFQLPPAGNASNPFAERGEAREPWREAWPLPPRGAAGGRLRAFSRASSSVSTAIGPPPTFWSAACEGGGGAPAGGAPAGGDASSENSDDAAARVSRFPLGERRCRRAGGGVAAAVEAPARKGGTDEVAEAVFRQKAAEKAPEKPPERAPESAAAKTSFDGGYPEKMQSKNAQAEKTNQNEEDGKDDDNNIKRAFMPPAPTEGASRWPTDFFPRGRHFELEASPEEDFGSGQRRDAEVAGAAEGGGGLPVRVPRFPAEDADRAGARPSPTAAAAAAAPAPAGGPTAVARGGAPPAAAAAPARGPLVPPSVDSDLDPTSAPAPADAAPAAAAETPRGSPPAPEAEPANSQSAPAKRIYDDTASDSEESSAPGTPTSTEKRLLSEAAAARVGAGSTECVGEDTRDDGEGVEEAERETE